MTKAKTQPKSAEKKSVPKVPYHRKPDQMTLETWQRALRKQFAEDSRFSIKKSGTHPVFGDYQVYNPLSDNTYKVALRSSENKLNFCTCPDFKTNGLGTCKHIEAVLHSIRKKKGLARILNQGYNPHYSSIYLKYGQERKVMLRIGSHQSDSFLKIAKPFFGEDQVLREDAFDKIETFLEKAYALGGEFRCYDDAMSFIIHVREKNKRTRFFEGINKEEYFENLIKAKLFSYQKEGILFAAKAGRALIADDMGLGKTIQAIATAELLKKEFKITRAIIVCPTSLKYQWKSEIEKFTNNKATVIEGNILKRIQLYQEDPNFYHIISYNVVANDVKHLNKAKPDMVILDEAQRIKNWKTKVAQGVKKLESDYAIVLTGTPLENKLEELYSIVQFIDPYRLGALFSFLENHQIKDEAGKVIGYKDLHHINTMLSDLLIRRTKKEVLKQLPARMDKILYVPMTEQQMMVHSDYDDLAKKIAFKWRKQGFLLEKDRQKLMLALAGMRMVCDSTYILDEETRHDTKIDELMSILDEALNDPEQKIVVFSQWERMTRLVAMELDKKKIGYENLHGGIPSEKRKGLFDNFNNNPQSRVFVSTDAGGVGLNLQAASLLINLDVPWNPAVLEQRIARIYRLGQKKNVNIINMVSTGTFEHKMLDVLKFKSSLAEGILDQGEDVIFMGESQFNKFMQSVEVLIDPEDHVVQATSIANVEDSTEEEHMGKEDSSNGKENEHVKKFGKQLSFVDEDLNREQKEKHTEIKTAVKNTPPEELISAGLDFFGKLSHTLSDPEATKKLVSSITQKDEATGQTFLKIPVENEKVVENVMNLFSGFLQALQKKSD